MTNNGNKNGYNGAPWFHTTHQSFYDYYASESQSEATLRRFRRVQATVLRMAAQAGLSGRLDVADIGCGAGTQARLWAEAGHHVFGLDVNEPLIRLARQRAEENNLSIEFEVGTATALPWASGTMDVCLLPELLEHVADWQSCLQEAARILQPGGLLYLSTTNVLCPFQEEFNLPLYSWYPAPLKRYYERLAVTTQPRLANYAKYPAVNWFTFYGLRDFLRPLGFRCKDRFDIMDTAGKGRLAQYIVTVLRKAPLLRFVGHMATPVTYLIAIKSGLKPNAT
jgi:2-polyprenyl-3-methyl-5-hydroxy-6-metoxy-1,4-benzoquinol methylase